MPVPEAPKVYSYTCAEVLVHGITHKKRVCGKVIQSFYKGQFDYWVAEHKAKHAGKKKEAPTLQALQKSK